MSKGAMARDSGSGLRHTRWVWGENRRQEHPSGKTMILGQSLRTVEVDVEFKPSVDVNSTILCVVV